MQEKGNVLLVEKVKGKLPGGNGKGKTRSTTLEAHSYLTTTPRARTNEMKRFPGLRGKALAALTPPQPSILVDPV